MHYAGYTASRNAVLTMDRQQLIDLIRSLYGFDAGYGYGGLWESELANYSDETLRAEALRQHGEEWTIPERHLNHYPDAEA